MSKYTHREWNVNTNDEFPALFFNNSCEKYWS